MVKRGWKIGHRKGWVTKKGGGGMVVMVKEGAKFEKIFRLNINMVTPCREVIK